MIGKELLKINDQLFLVNRKLPEHYQIDTKWWKFKTKSDKVFRAQGFYYFVEQIQDVEPIEDGQLSLDFK
jgi:hypothetical protein